jgi:DNA-binding NarL/FixJ family response regulator
MIVVGEAREGHSALRLATELQPDVMVLDISLPGLDGPRVAKCVRETSPRTCILVHSVHEDRLIFGRRSTSASKAIFSSVLRGTNWSARSDPLRTGAFMSIR